MSDSIPPAPEVTPEEKPEVKPEDATVPPNPAVTDENKAEKKKKKKNKKNAQKGTIKPISRCLGGFTDEFVQRGQTDPPTKPVRLIYGGAYPQGEISEHPGDYNLHRTTDEEIRAMERLSEDDYKDFRKAAMVHKHVRKYAQSQLKPGVNLFDFCQDLEDRIRILMEEKGPEEGIGFPCGVSINNVAAHFTPNPGDDPVIVKEGDVIKVDFGTQCHGNIIDCAYTVAFQEKFDPLLEAVKETTNLGIKMAGIDARLDEIGAAIEECMLSHEITLDGQTHQILPVANLSGHNMNKWMVHSGKSVPLVKGGEKIRMDEGEIFAIETFGSTGKGEVVDLEGQTSHYMVAEDGYANLRLDSARKLLNHLKKTFKTLAFCPRFIDRPDGGSAFLWGQNGRQKNYRGALKNLCDNGVVVPYPPLADVKGSYVAQWEHTILLRPTCKEVVSRGDDY